MSLYPTKYYDVYTNPYYLNIPMLDRSRGSIREYISNKEIVDQLQLK